MWVITISNTKKSIIKYIGSLLAHQRIFRRRLPKSILYGVKKGILLQWDFKKPEVKWFAGAKLNITENCIDRHLATGGVKTVALLNPEVVQRTMDHRL